MNLALVNLNPVQTLALALGLGAIVSLLSMRLRVPPILPLLLVGVGVGRSGLGLVDATKLQPALVGIISVSVALLVFEGSLHLDRRALAQSPRAVRGLLTLGAAVTWVLAAVGANVLLGLSWGPSIVLGAMLIVTGPTVIQPILRRVPLTPNLHAALTAEGVLIDPIGVLAAVPTLEVVRGLLAGSQSVGAEQLLHLYALPLAVGGLAGGVCGLTAAQLMKRTSAYDEAADYRLNLLAMGAVMVAVGVSESFARESGLVAAAVCGIVIANSRIVGARQIRQFKEQISGFLVGALFILLAARFEVSRLAAIGWNEALFVAALILVVRPLSVAVGAYGSALSVRERLFAAFLAPRGIVAASLASIVAIEFASLASVFRQTARELPEVAEAAELVRYADRIQAEGQTIEIMMFMVIVVTVALGGILAGPVASLLGVRAGRPNGLAIIGAHRLGRELAAALAKEKIPVRLVDTNANNIAAAKSMGLSATLGDATDLRWLDEMVGTPETGWVLAATGNADVDTVIWRWGSQRFGAGHAFRWAQRPGEGSSEEETVPAIGDQRPLPEVLADLEAGRSRVETWTGQHAAGVPFALIEDGRARLVAKGFAREQAPPKARVIGLVNTDERADVTTFGAEGGGAERA